MDNITETYLNEIIMEAHAKPMFGWSSSNFEKTIRKTLIKLIKKEASDFFNDYFCFKKIYDFSDMFKKPAEAEFDGAGASLYIKLVYTAKLAKKDAEKFLYGIKGKNGGYSVKGILFNKSFMDSLEIAESSGGDDLAEGDDANSETGVAGKIGHDAELDESVASFHDVYMNNIINEGLIDGVKKLFNKKSSIPPFDKEDADKNLGIDGKGELTFSVIFEFENPDYCKNFKQKEQFNLNRLSGMTGQIYFKFGSKEEFSVTGDGGIKWQQKRTESMDPPKPMRQQIKEAWNSGKAGQSAGLLGLAAKKLVGGMASAATGLPMGGGAVVQEAAFNIKFNDAYSMKNMQDEKIKGKRLDDSEKPTADYDKLEKMLSSKCDGVDWLVKKNEDGKFECLATVSGVNLLKVIIKLG